MVLTPEGRVQGVIQPILFSLHCRLQLRVRRKPVSLFEFGGYLQTSSSSQRPTLVMDVERLDILGNIVQGRVTTDPQYLEEDVVMVEVVILEDMVTKVMVVTSSVGVMGR